MPFFQYKKLNSTDVANLVIESNKLAIYANAHSFMGFPGAKLLNLLNDIGGNLQANKYHIGVPNGWREVAPTELNLSPSVLDKRGYYTFHSPALGKAPNGTGPQAKIFAKYEQGKIAKVALSVAGTNDLLDIADYFHLNSGKVVPPLEPLLNAVKDFALKHKLTSEDVIVTGYSLGAAVTNLVAKYADTLSGGFYKNSHFLAFASPYIFDNPEMILNLGYENDAVYRFLGNEKTLGESLKATKPGLVNADKPFASAADNMVLFDNHYGSAFYNPKLQSFILKSSWSAHAQGVRTDAYERILKSPFYEYMSLDDKVVIDQLTLFKRWCTWVRDKGLDNKGANSHSIFMFGNEYNNLLQGSQSSDYIDAGGGNDKIRVGQGADRVNGGTGIDTLVLAGKQSDWEAFHLQDQTLFLHSKNRAGLVQAESVERVEFQGDIRTLAKPYEVRDDGLYDRRFVIKAKNHNIDYAPHKEGSDYADNLAGKIIFAKKGNDKLTAVTSGSLLHAGEGDDILIGGRGADELFGAEGNDVLYASKGLDHLYGGVGNDLFVFTKENAGHSFIRDFNDYSGDRDKLLFSQSLFSTAEQAISAMRQKGNHVVLDKYNLHLVVENTQLSELDYMSVGIV